MATIYASSALRAKQTIPLSLGKNIYTKMLKLTELKYNLEDNVKLLLLVTMNSKYKITILLSLNPMQSYFIKK